jgi:hypothetical protein
MNKLSRLTVGGIGIALALGAALLGRSVIAGSSIADLENTCTIDAQTAYEGISLDRSVSPGGLASVAEANALATEPGASVAEVQTGRASSSTIPVVNGHNVVLVRMDNVAPVPIFGPANTGLTKAVTSAPSCDIAIYDTDTGGLLVDMKTLPYH